MLNCLLLCFRKKGVHQGFCLKIAVELYQCQVNWWFGLVYGVNATFNNISIVLSRSVLWVEETGIPEKTTELSQVTDKLYHIMLYRVHPDMSGFELTAFVVIGTDCTGSCTSSYHMIMTMTSPYVNWEMFGLIYMF